MIFLAFNTLEDAQTAAAQVDSVYGCPYQEGDYVMETWADIQELEGGKLGFEKPKAFLGKSLLQLLAAITPDYEEVEL